MLLAMMLHVSADVLFKRLAGQPIRGTIELVSTYYMVGCVFLGIGVVQQQRKQIAVEFFADNLGTRARKVIDIFAGLVTLFFVVLLVWKGGEQAFTSSMDRETNWSTIFSIEIWPTRWFPVLGFACMFAYLALQVLADVRSLLTGEFGENK